MATPIRIKRSAVAGKKPTEEQLQLGELAVNFYDGKVFLKQDTGGAGISTGVVEVGGNLDQLQVTGVSTFTGNIDANGNLDVDGHTELDDLNVSGVSTFAGAADFNGSVDIDGHTELNNVNVSGVSTFSSVVNATSAVNATDIIKGYKYTAVPYGSTVTLAVTVASKDSTHRYNGTGSGNAYVIDGIQAPFLTLTPGRTI